MRAQRFLADPERTVAETAMLCGYESFSSFNRMFKQIKGARPVSSGRYIILLFRHFIHPAR